MRKSKTLTIPYQTFAIERRHQRNVNQENDCFSVFMTSMYAKLEAVPLKFSYVFMDAFLDSVVLRYPWGDKSAVNTFQLDWKVFDGINLLGFYVSRNGCFIQRRTLGLSRHFELIEDEI